MERTALGHLQKVPHMVQIVREYERDEDMHGTGSYENLRNYFIAREIEHLEDKATLGQVETANASVPGVLQELQCEMANLVTKNSELEEALVAIAGSMENQKKVANKTSPPPLVQDKSEMERLFAAFLAGQQPAKVPSAPSTSELEKKLQEVLDGIQSNKRNVRRSKKTREPYPKFIFYCDSHGCNKSHNSDGCRNKKPFHDDNVTFSNPNPKLGIMWNKDVYMRPGSGY